MLEKPDRVSSLLSATRKVCRPAQVRDGYSFTKLQMLEEGHLAPEHTQVNHQLCQKSLKSFKRHPDSSHSLLGAPAKAPPAFEKGSKESNDWHRQRANSWLPASALGPHLRTELPPSACGSGEKRKPKSYPSFNDSLLRAVLWAKQQTEGKEHGKCKVGTKSPAHVSLWLPTVGSSGI